MSMNVDLNEFRRGWTIVLACFVGIGLGMVPVAGSYSIGVLTISLSEEFGWGRGDIMLAPVMLYFGLIPTSFLVGWIADHYGVRKMTMFSLLAIAVSFIALGTFAAGSLVVFLSIYLLMGFFGEAAGPISYTRSIVGWFRNNRGLALGMAMAGAGTAGIVIPAYTGWLVEQYGWRGAYLGLAALPICITLPIVFFMLKEVPRVAARQRGEPAKPMNGLSFKEAISGYRYWVLAIVFSCVTAVVVAVITNLVPMLTDDGYDLPTATKMASVIGISVLFGRLLVGYLVDRFWAPMIGVIIFIPASIAFVLLAHSEWGMWPTVAGIALIGFVTGAETDLLIYMMTRYFGQKAYGILFALMYVCYNSVTASGPPIYGYAYDAMGSYDTVLFVSSGILIASALLLLTLGKYPPRWNPPNEKPQ